MALLALNSRDPVYKKLKQIAHAGNKANSLVRQLLAFSRKQNIKPEFININQLIKGIEKIRFMTSNPWDFHDELIEEIANNPKIDRFIHLPVQSGSNRILEF